MSNKTQRRKIFLKKQSKGRFQFKKTLINDWFEMLIELLIIALDIIILWLLPLPIFEEWLELAMLMDIGVIIAVGGLVALVIHLIKREKINAIYIKIL